MKNKNDILNRLRGGLVVSCQALPNEPLHGSDIMAKMAYAAMLGGAVGIRANSVSDITCIKQVVKLPIIGIIKKEYDNSDVFITPTSKEVEALIECGVEIIAMDATTRKRPSGVLSEIFPALRKKYYDTVFMADCSTVDEGIYAEALGFDIVGTTLAGYTPYTKGRRLPDYELMSELSRKLSVPVVAEGGIWTPEQLSHVFNQGVYFAVTGTAITRPMDITKRFVSVLPNNSELR